MSIKKMKASKPPPTGASPADPDAKAVGRQKRGRSRMMNTTPNRIDLVTFWMETRFKDVPCVVFFEPLGDGERISLFTNELGCGTGDIINSDIFIFPTNNPDSILKKLPQDIWGFVMSWDGENFTGQN